MVPLAPDALDLAAGVGKCHYITELNIRGVAPIGHIDGRGAVAHVADRFGAGQFTAATKVLQEFPPARIVLFTERAAASANRPLPIDVELPKVVEIGFRFPSFFRVGLPPGNPFAAANHCGFVRRRPIDHVMSARSGVRRVEDDRLHNWIRPAAEHNHDVASHVLIDRADRQPGLFDRGKRLGFCAGICVVAPRSNIECGLHRRRSSRRRRKKNQGRNQPVSCLHEPFSFLEVNAAVNMVRNSSVVGQAVMGCSYEFRRLCGRPWDVGWARPRPTTIRRQSARSKF